MRKNKNTQRNPKADNSYYSGCILCPYAIQLSKQIENRIGVHTHVHISGLLVYKDKYATIFYTLFGILDPMET